MSLRDKRDKLAAFLAVCSIMGMTVSMGVLHPTLMFFIGLGGFVFAVGLSAAGKD